MLKLLSAFCILFLLFTSSCQTYSDWFGPPFTIQTLSLFNQRTDVLEGTQKTWKGDWLFRRKRLQLVDDAINKKSPNIIFFQEMMEKSSKSDSDATILGYSSLAYHQPFFFPYKKYKETGEKESAAIYIRMGNHNIESETQNPIIALENNGYVAFQKILLNNVPFYLINIKMGEGEVVKGFNDLQKAIQTHLDQVDQCYNQVIVAGHFKGQTNHPSFISFLKKFDLIDSAREFCEMNKHCHTESASNPILSSSTLDNDLYRSERILIHSSSKVYNSEIAFNREIQSFSDFKEKYNLYTITPSIRYGWEAKVSFGICLNRKQTKK